MFGNSNTQKLCTSKIWTYMVLCSGNWCIHKTCCRCVCVFVCLFVAVMAHCTEWSLSPVLVSGKESLRGQNKLQPRKPRLVGPVKILLASYIHIASGCLVIWLGSTTFRFKEKLVPVNLLLSLSQCPLDKTFDKVHFLGKLVVVTRGYSKQNGRAFFRSKKHLFLIQDTFIGY